MQKVTTRQQISQVQQQQHFPTKQQLKSKIALFVIIMAIVSMTVDYGSLKGGDAGKG